MSTHHPSLEELIAAAKKLIESVEYDVNGSLGKGGHGGLTSNDTIRSAGNLRIIISRFVPTQAEPTPKGDTNEDH